MMTHSNQKESSLKVFFSYFWSLTRKIDTDYNGLLFLTLFKGRKILNSEHANYSFGALQQILEVGLSKINFENINSILVLGLGGGSVVFSLREKFKYEGKIVAVELDQKLIDIARDEFSIVSTNNLTIHNNDAFEFIKKCKNPFDLIIVDLFIDNVVPEKFYSEEFCQNLSNAVSQKGSILYNLGIHQMDQEKRNSVIHFFKNREEYKTSQNEKVGGTNFLLIAEKNIQYESI